MNQTYQCDECGACCEFFMAFATHVDARREPKLMDADLSGQRIPLTLLAVGHQVILSQGVGNPCQMLTKKYGGKKRCSIYQTRPTRCVEFEPGSAACQQAREGLGIGPLLPIQRDDHAEEVRRTKDAGTRAETINAAIDRHRPRATRRRTTRR